MVISASSFCRKRPRVISQVLRKGPNDRTLAGRQMNSMSDLTYRCIRKHQRHLSCYESGGMEPARVFRKFGPVEVSLRE